MTVGGYAGTSLIAWHPAPVNRLQESELCRALGVSPLLARILVARGLGDPAGARAFLADDMETLRSPWQLPGMTAAAARLAQAVRLRERVLVYGDYDADGVCSTALLLDFLRRLGVPANYYIPERVDGYGLHGEALAAARAEGYSLVVTVDCGVTAAVEVGMAVQMGLEVIVTDHHQPAGDLPPALAVVNPLLEAELGPVLAGVGVAFKLAQATGELLELEKGFAGLQAGDWLDLVALGTVADVVPLLGDNRLLVKAGLRLMALAPRPGLAALLQVGKLPETPGSETIAFGLAPRLNAAGRMGSAEPAVELLLERSPQRAWDLARRLERENRTRQLVEEQILQDALRRVEQEIDLEREAAVALASPLWHEGVVGIVAGRLAERLRRPVVLIALAGGTGKGSGRSALGIDLFAAVSRCKEVLTAFGGHRQAVGLSLAADRVEEFRQLLHEAVAAQGSGRAQAERPMDAEVLLCELSPAAVREMAALAPFGEGNPEPLLVCRGVRLTSMRAVGKRGDHLRFSVAGDGQALDGIGFRQAELARRVSVGEPVDLLFQPQMNSWQGEERLELRLLDLQPGGGVALPAEEAGESVFPALAKGNGLLLVFPPPELAFQARCLRSLLDPSGIKLRVAAADSTKAEVGELAAALQPGNALLASPGAFSLLGRAETDTAAALERPRPLRERVWLQDGRDKDVVPALLTLAASGRLVVPCPDREAAAALEAGLRRAGAGQVLHWDWETPRALLAEELIRVGHFRIALVPRLGSLPLPGGEWTLALAWPPSCRMELQEAFTCGASGVHLLYHRAAVEKYSQRLAASYPDRDALGRLYRLLRPLGEKETYLGRRDIQRIYRRSGLLPPGEGCGMGLATLEELDLIRLRCQGDGCYMTLLPAPPDKRDLETSWRFREGEEIKRAWRELAGRLLSPAQALAEGLEGVEVLDATGTEGTHPGNCGFPAAGHQF